MRQIYHQSIPGP